MVFQSAGRIIGWLKYPRGLRRLRADGVSIRRADYWLVEVRGSVGNANTGEKFQSAGRIIGWLKCKQRRIFRRQEEFQSAGRIIGWLK